MITNMKTLEEIEREIIQCRACPRLVSWREEVARKKKRAYQEQTYWGKPVPGFGDVQAEVMVVGLAPGAHGSNRTGRMFTGDSSGDFLYSALFRAGFANQPVSRSRDDRLQLKGVFITSVCRCAPPGNKPLPSEMDACLQWFENEMALLNHRMVGMVALGKIAFDRILAFYRKEGYGIPPFPFRHGKYYDLGNGLPWLVASYHPSRQNTQTGRLTTDMFDSVWNKVHWLLDRRENLKEAV